MKQLQLNLDIALAKNYKLVYKYIALLKVNANYR